MSKMAGRMNRMRKVMEKVDHNTPLKTNIPAGLAMPGPPLGPMLGQRNINIAAFCKDFNERTETIKEGIPLPCRIKVNSDRSYDLVIYQPPATYFLKQAAGIAKGSVNKDDKIAGKITLKHLYEIAKIKSSDPPLVLKSLQEITQMLVGVAHSCGIKVVKELDASEYADFLEKRKELVAEQARLLQETKEAKMLRTA